MIDNVRDLYLGVNALLRKLPPVVNDGHVVIGSAELAVQIQREGLHRRVDLRIVHLGGQTIPGKMMIVLDGHGNLVEFSSKHDSNEPGKTTYRAFNIPPHVSVQVRLVEPSFMDTEEE